jgi:two-component system, cell cycle sensor histidine kinase and response regulator CckA
MTMQKTLRVLIVDDSADDALLINEALAVEGDQIIFKRVDNAAGLQAALGTESWDVVISDYAMPAFTTEEALRIVKQSGVAVPFIVVSGVIGEDAAVGIMRAGAVDYVMKNRLGRLLPAIRREMSDMLARRGRDEAEVALNEVRRRLAATVERAPVGIVNVSRGGHFVHVNSRFCEMVGYSSDELMTLRFADITHPDDGVRDSAFMLQILRGELAEYRTENRYVRKDGAIVFVSLSTVPILDNNGQFQYFASFMLDITERKQMESALRERDERYRQIVDTAQEGIWTIDTAGRTTFVNNRMAEMLGYTIEDMLGRPLFDFVHEHDHKRVLRDTERRRDGLSDTDDFIMVCKNGQSIRIHFTANPLKDADGTHIGALAMVTDITARWEAEQTALRQKRELEEAQRIAHIGSWRRDLPGNVIQMSDELQSIFGFDKSATLTRDSLLEIVLAEDRARVLASIIHAQETGQSFNLGYRIVRPDGGIRSVYTHGEVTLNAAGTPIQLHGVTQDVTDRVDAAVVHQKLNRDLQLLLQSTTQGIFGVDSKGRCTFINRSASESLGYLPGTLIGESMHEVLHQTKDDVLHAPSDCPIETTTRTGSGSEVQSDMLYRSDGTILPVEYSAAPIIDNGSVAGAVVVFTDVSERKLLQAQLEQSDRVSSLGRLAATMAHEFNNVLMGIQPFAELLSRQNPTESVQRASHNILQAVQRGRSITHGILRFARPTELVKEKIDVKHWLQSMDAALAAVLGDRVHLRMRIDGDSLFVRGDSHQLEQVMTNLAANARDAMNGQGEFSIVVQRCLSGYVFPFGSIRTIDQYLHISVTDTGCGMDAKTLKDIFDPFFTTKRSGTGLGLAVVHQVMKLHGGSIIAESSVGTGTVFHLFLPFSQEAFEEPAKKPLEVLLPEIESVLLVEDDEAISSGVAGLLRAEGIIVDIAANGKAAMKALSTHVPDVVILDLNLPDIDGISLFEQIAADHADLAVIFASGSGDENISRRYLKEGQIAALAKPYEFDDLLAVLGTLRKMPAPFLVPVHVMSS